MEQCRKSPVHQEEGASARSKEEREMELSEKRLLSDAQEQRVGSEDVAPWSAETEEWLLKWILTALITSGDFRVLSLECFSLLINRDMECLVPCPSYLEIGYLILKRSVSHCAWERWIYSLKRESAPEEQAPPQGLLSQASCLPLDPDAETVWSRLIFHTLSILQVWSVDVSRGGQLWESLSLNQTPIRWGLLKIFFSDVCVLKSLRKSRVPPWGVNYAVKPFALGNLISFIHLSNWIARIQNR